MRFCSAAASLPPFPYQFLRDLQQISHNHLVVGRILLVLVDRFRNEHGIGRLRLVIVIVGIGRHGSARQPNPQLRGTALVAAHGIALGFFRVLIKQLQLFKGQREEANMFPLLQHVGPLKSERLAAPANVNGHRRKRVSHLVSGDALQELHCAQVMAVQARRQVAQHGVVLVRRNAFDDQLLTRHTQREGRALVQQGIETPGEPGGRSLQQRMPRRVYRVLVEPDRKFDQEIRQFTR